MNPASQPLSAKAIGLWLGPVLALGIVLMGAPPELVAEDAIFSPAWLTLALLVWMAVWWVTEAIPIPVTALLPLVVLPVMGVLPLKQVASAYMNPIIVLLMGGFIFAKAIQRWNLHERVALNVVQRFGATPRSMIGGFMLASALLSMWISNSATAIMMMPIAISVAQNMFGPDDKRGLAFTTALLLAIAYACSIGGLATPIGTPTNLIVIGYLDEVGGFDISFTQWMMLGLPTVALLLPMAWLLLTRRSADLPDRMREDTKGVIVRRLAELGEVSGTEKRTIALFVFIALLWMTGPLYRDFSLEIAGDVVQPFAYLSDHIVAIIAVLLCFLIPAGGENTEGEKLLDWKSAEEIPWGTLLLFGGGLSMAGAIGSTGLGIFFGNALTGLASLPLPLLILLIVAMVLLLTEVTSNVATASVVLPILGAMAIGAGIPVETIAIPIALAASCAFMLPMATGPNAVIFSSGQVTIKDMIRNGLRVNAGAAVLIAVIAYYLPSLVF